MDHLNEKEGPDGWIPEGQPIPEGDYPREEFYEDLVQELKEVVSSSWTGQGVQTWIKSREAYYEQGRYEELEKMRAWRQQ